jgi:hypothetical protein
MRPPAAGRRTHPSAPGTYLLATGEPHTFLSHFLAIGSYREAYGLS